MCGIIASFDKNFLKSLYELNAYRGEKTHSVSVYDLSTKKLSVTRNNYGFTYEILDDIAMAGNEYVIIHSQAPTSNNTTDAIHPAECDSSLLWHNGLLKTFEVSRLQEKHDTSIEWDTALLLRELLEIDYLNNLSNLNGSFAGILFRDNAFSIFRNEIAPLFIDDSLNISSTKFPHSYPLIPNQIHVMDLEVKKLNETSEKFTTLENPYFF